MGPCLWHYTDESHQLTGHVRNIFHHTILFLKTCLKSTNLGKGVKAPHASRDLLFQSLLGLCQTACK